MRTRVGDIMMSLRDYAVVFEEATLLEALEALRASVEKLPPDKQPHRAVLVQDRRGEIIGKVHHFAFLRALVPDRRSVSNLAVLDRAGVGDDLRESSMRTLDLLTSDLVNICERARSVRVRDFYTSTTVSIQESASLSEAIQSFLSHQTLSLLVRRGEKTVGILRLSDLFDELSRQILEGSCTD
jgi:CBS domain containing-hemolysin-like protein